MAKNISRRAILRGMAATAATATTAGALMDWSRAWAADAPFRPESGARLRILRWKRFIQSEEDAFMALVSAFGKATGVGVEVMSESMDDVQPKASVAVNVGSGPDLIWGLFSLPHLFPQKCTDLSDVANYLGKRAGGWVAAAEKYGKHGKRWIAIPMCFSGNYINYRKSAVQKAGFQTIPQDLDGFLALCRALKGVGMPAGMALGHATGDGNAWAHWALWAHGAAMVDENDKVILRSPESVAACEYVKKLYQAFIPGTASWNDGSNNKAFMAGQVSLTNNAISIYQNALNEGLPIKDDIEHAHFPVGPVGRPTEFHLAFPMMVPSYSKFPQAAKALITYLMDAAQYSRWLEGSVAYLTHSLNAFDTHPIWTSDRKRTIFKDAAKRTLVAGYKGSIGQKAAAALSEFIILDMFANCATGQMLAKAAVADATKKARRVYR